MSSVKLKMQNSDLPEWLNLSKSRSSGSQKMIKSAFFYKFHSFRDV